MRIYASSFLIPMPPVSALTPFVSSALDGRVSDDGSGVTGGGGRSIAPGKVTLTSRIPGRPGEAPEPTSLTESYSDRPPRPSLDDPFGLHLESGGAQPAAPAAAPHLATSAEVDFGEVPVGEIQREKAFVYNLNPTGSAYVNALLAGSHDIQLSHPQSQRLRPSREDPGIPFTLVYQPKERGKVQATLTVDANWETYTGWAPLTVQIPVTATAYAYGEERPSVVEAEKARDQEAALAAAAEKERDVALDRQAEADNKIKKSYPQGAENKLNDAFIRAHDALDLMTKNQEIGVGVAAAEAQSFRRRIPVQDPSLLFTLAMMALDMGTASLASTVSAGIKSAMAGPDGKASSMTHFVAEALRTGIKDAGKSARKSRFEKETSERTESSDARINFFAEQEVALADSKFERAKALGDALRRLRPLMRGEKPEDAAEAMSAVAQGLEEGVKAARALQADEARFAWMRFLSQTELGSLSPDQAKQSGLKPRAEGEPILDIGTALNVPKEYEPLPRYDGVLDLELSADYHSPRDTLKIAKAKMNGVTPAMARSLSLFPLSELLKRGVVIRAHFKIRELAVMPVVAVFDGDRITFADQTGAAGQEPHWLSVFGGHLGAPTPERQRLGAVALRDRLKTQTLDALGLQVETDHAGG